MSSALKEMYTTHHHSGRRGGFSILETERGALFGLLVGENKSVLDIGCRDGTLTRYFTKNNTVLGVDIDEELLQKAHAEYGIETTIFDLNGAWNELGEKKFDVVVAGEVVEHLFFPPEVFKKVSAHLNTGGVFAGSVPNAFTLKHRVRYMFAVKKHTPLSDPTHINHFSVEELRILLENYFQNVEIYGLGKYKFLSKHFPSFFAFDLVFRATKRT